MEMHGKEDCPSSWALSPVVISAGSIVIKPVIGAWSVGSSFGALGQKGGFVSALRRTGEFFLDSRFLIGSIQSNPDQKYVLYK